MSALAGQLDLFEGRRRRNEGMAQTLDHNPSWCERAMRLIATKLTPRDLTGEDLRVWLIENGLDVPGHANAWGALCNTAVRRGYLEKTGRYAPMKLPKSHARITPVYRSTGIG